MKLSKKLILFPLLSFSFLLLARAEVKVPAKVDELKVPVVKTKEVLKPTTKKAEGKASPAAKAEEKASPAAKAEEKASPAAKAEGKASPAAKAKELEKTGVKSKPKEVKEKDVVSPPEVKAKTQCRFTIFGNDRMQFVDEKDKVIKEIKIPFECDELSLDFAYKGKLSSSIMGHNIVISEEKNKNAVISEALKQGKKNSYLPAGQVATDFVIAASKHILGGGKEDFQKETILVEMAKVDPEKKYTFFCAFPGHALIMKGSFAREKSKVSSPSKKTSKPVNPVKAAISKVEEKKSSSPSKEAQKPVNAVKAPSLKEKKPSSPSKEAQKPVKAPSLKEKKSSPIGTKASQG